MVTLRSLHAAFKRFTQFDPFEDTESAFSVATTGKTRGFTQFDPFEDTERANPWIKPLLAEMFHPIRSVRGY